MDMGAKGGGMGRKGGKLRVGSGHQTSMGTPSTWGPLLATAGVQIKLDTESTVQGEGTCDGGNKTGLGLGLRLGLGLGLGEASNMGWGTRGTA